MEVALEAAPLDGELTPVNNRAAVDIEGIRENLRVLLISGEPHAGERTWRNLLKSDPSVDLVHFTILRPPEKQDGTPINELSLIAFPTRELFEEKIDQFDLIIFDRYQSRGVLPIVYYDNLARYVREGGAVYDVVVSAGERSGTLGPYGGAAGAAGWTTWTGEPSGAANTVRNASCRRTISPSVRASTPGSSGPSTRSATGML